jgi:TolA-binding protein
MRSAYADASPRLKKLMTEKGIPAVVRDEAYYQMALVQVVQNKFADAQKTIRELTSISKLGESVERARMLNGEIYVQQGNYLGAANEFRSFKQTFPNSPHIPRIDMMLPGIEKKLNASGK